MGEEGGPVSGIGVASEGADGCEAFGHVSCAKRRARTLFKQREITRAFRAAQKAGIDVRIDVTPDGKLSIVPVTIEDGQKQSNAWDEVFDKTPSGIRPRLS
jgi:hypothetical protein